MVNRLSPYLIAQAAMTSPTPNDDPRSISIEDSGLPQSVINTIDRHNTDMRWGYGGRFSGVTTEIHNLGQLADQAANIDGLWSMGRKRLLAVQECFDRHGINAKVPIKPPLRQPQFQLEISGINAHAAAPLDQELKELVTDLFQQAGLPVTRGALPEPVKQKLVEALSFARQNRPKNPTID